jgi:hypothetical protein
MKTSIQKSLQTTLGLALIFISAYGIWWLVRTFIDAISAASPEVSAAIVGAMATILGGVLAILLSQAHERKRAAEDAHRLRKVEIYQGFIDMITKLIGASNENLSIQEPDPQELIEYLFKLKADILLWGSPKVIKAQINFEAVAGSGNTGKIFHSVNSLYLAIREDVGLSNFGLNNLELVKLYLNDDARKQLGR